MSVRVPRSAPPAQRARMLVEANLRELERPVLRTVRGRLASENIHLPHPDLEAAYNQAWHGVCEMVSQGREVESLNGLLVTITWRRAIDAYRQRNEALHADAMLEDHASETDLAEQVDDQQKLNHLIGRLVQRLNPKERNAVTLCLLHGYTRPEAAQRLGIPEPAMQKIMDGATKKIAGIVAGIDARGCGGDEWARALRAFALGLTGEDSRDYPRIVQHIEECEACKRYVMGLRALSAVLPPLLPFGHGLAAVLAHMRRLFAPGRNGTSAGAHGAQTTGAIAGGGGSSVGSASSGLTGVLGGAGAKAIAVVATGLAVAGAATFRVATHHRARAHPVAATPLPPLPSTFAALLIAPTFDGSTSVPAPSPVGKSSPQRHRAALASSKSDRGRTQARASRHSTAVSTEFGIEPSTRTGSAAAQEPTSTQSSSPPPQQEHQSEFGIE